MKEICSRPSTGYKNYASKNGECPVLFRSTDKGATWSSLDTQTGVLRGSLFVFNGDLYLLGGNDTTDNKPVRVMKSADNGTSWTSAGFENRSGPGTPNNPVVWSNRLWSSSGLGSFSSPTDSNLLIEASWKSVGGFPTDRTGWIIPADTTLSEGQIMASPELGVFNMPKVKDYAYTALSRVNSSGTVTFDPVNNFVALPGGEKKFVRLMTEDPGSFLF